MRATPELSSKFGGHKREWMLQIRGPLRFCMLAKWRQQGFHGPNNNLDVPKKHLEDRLLFVLFFCFNRNLLGFSLLSFMKKRDSVKLVQEPGIYPEKSSWIVSALGPRNSFLFFFSRKSAETFARKLESPKNSWKMFPQAKRPWLQTQTVTFLLGRERRTPQNRACGYLENNC